MTDIVITCPACETRYKSSEEAIGPNGRTVRCAKCSETWFVPASDVMSPAQAEALADEKALEETLIGRDTVIESGEDEPVSGAASSVPASKTADVMMRDQADARKLAHRRRTIAIIWIVPLILVIIAAILAYIYRQPIVNRIPQSATLYQTLGIEVRKGGLEIDPPVARTLIVDGTPVVRIESAVRNLSNQRVSVPLIELTLHDAGGTALAQWYVEPERRSLRPKGRLAFTTEYADPPAEATGLRYKFAESS